MIQYPKNNHITLPSVEGAFGTTNILRDPPKSIHTRYIPKVGETSDITQLIQDSGDRVCEVIKPYARGINPMVSVSYSNYGTNGGQVRYRGGAVGTDQNPISIRGTAVQSSYPYKIMQDGAFRPPIVPPQDLLPLSRLPRALTKQQTNPGSDWMRMEKTLSCNNKDLRQVRQELLKVCSAPKATFNIERPQKATYDIKNNIQENKRLVIANTARAKKRHTLNVNEKPQRGIVANVPHAFASTKASSNIQVKPVHMQAQGNQPLPIKDRVNSTCVSNISKRGEGQAFMHYARKHDSVLPRASASTNACQRGVDLNNSINDRTYRNLQHRRNRGGFDNGGQQQRFERQVPPVKISDKLSVFQLANQEKYKR